MMDSSQLARDIRELPRFAEKIVENGDCWEWRGAHVRKGYGTAVWNGKTRKTHRISYEYTFGAIPLGMCVCHRCDNPACVRPDHLFLGSNTDNVHDMMAKGRARGQITAETSGARLTEAQAKEIIASAAAGELTRSLCKRFGVVRFTIHALLRGETWPHLERPPGIPRKSGAYDHRAAGRALLETSDVK